MFLAEPAYASVFPDTLQVSDTNPTLQQQQQQKKKKKKKEKKEWMNEWMNEMERKEKKDSRLKPVTIM